VTTASLPADKEEADLETESTFGREGSRAVALVAPTGRDSKVAERILASAGIETILCPDMADACQAIDDGRAGVMLLAEEALNKNGRKCLLQLLESQPSWSDLPIVLLTGQDELSG